MLVIQLLGRDVIVAQRIQKCNKKRTTNSRALVEERY